MRRRRRKRGTAGADDGGRGRRTPGRRRARGDVDRAPACRRIDSFRTGVKTPLTAADDASAAAASAADADAFSRFYYK